ncbi:MAG: hypothetical protein GY796_34745 [Chloroflexi bacterium]|nr:hypothetical protein [Chloroflexota bacterium]
MENWTTTWQTELTLAVCEHCDWLFALPNGRLPLPCPHCAQQDLTALDTEADRPIYTQPPELTLPFRYETERVRQQLTTFAKKGWLAPQDLTAEKLHGRLQSLYLPMWLVDAGVQAQWQAEMGFNYDIVSHKEAFRNNNWHTRKVKETRIRWQPRAGTLQRHYDNQTAPALEEQPDIEKRLGQFDLKESRPYTPDILQHSLIRLPNRSPEDAWPDAQIGLKQTAAAECRQAAAADHVRRHTWQPTYHNTHWTQLLYPVYTTTYTDDNNRTHTLYIHGQTGRLIGPYKASMKKAQKYSLGIGIGAGIMFALAFIMFLLGFVWEPTFVIVGLLFLMGMFTAVTAFIPILYAWYTNNVKLKKL